MKKILLIFAIIFVSGIIAADICVSGLKNENMLINIEVFKNYAYADTIFKQVIWNMLYERGKLIVCLLVLCITPLRNHMPIIFACVFSFCFGFFMMSCVLVLGFIGVIVALSSILPHGLFYIGIFVILFRRFNMHGYRPNKGVAQSVGTYLFMLLLYVTGCVMECVMGVHFIPWVIRLSLV